MITSMINTNCTKNVSDRTVAQSGLCCNMLPPEMSEALLEISMYVDTQVSQDRLENHH